MPIDHLLIIGFGGPTKPEEIQPFLERVTRGRNIPEARCEEVARHYEAVGGKSPYNEHTFQLVEKLKKSLHTSGTDIPIFVGMRNSEPFLKETLSEIQAKGLKQGLGIILAPHRSENSCKRYKQNVEQAKHDAGAQDIHYDYLEPWHAHPLYIEAQAEQVQALSKEEGIDLHKTHLIFCAHSIPIATGKLCDFCDYAGEFEVTSKLLADTLRHSHWSLAYQSRSGNPREPWLEPSVEEVIRARKEAGDEAVVVIPVGFLCDNVEVLYDLDIEAKEEAQKSGIAFYRTSSVMDHPKFVLMLQELIQSVLQGSKGSSEILLCTAS